MLKLTTAAARRDLADVIKRVRSTKQRVVITRYGQPLVAVISIEDLARLDRGGAGPARRTGGKSSAGARRR
jgi:prevent-host-death family protein